MSPSLCLRLTALLLKDPGRVNHNLLLELEVGILPAAPTEPASHKAPRPLAH